MLSNAYTVLDTQITFEQTFNEKVRPQRQIQEKANEDNMYHRLQCPWEQKEQNQ